MIKYNPFKPHVVTIAERFYIRKLFFSFKPFGFIYKYFNDRTIEYSLWMDLKYSVISHSNLEVLINNYNARIKLERESKKYLEEVRKYNKPKFYSILK